MSRSSVAPALIAVAGIGLLSLMDGLIKYVSVEHATTQVAALRYAFGAVFAFAVFRASGTAWPNWATLRPHAWRSVIVAVTALSFFYSLSVLPLATALALSFTSPIFIAMLAAVVLGERPGKSIYIALVLGFVGVLVVLSDELGRGEARGDVFGVAAALVAAVTYAAAMVTLKSRAARDPLPTIVLLQNGFAGLLLAPAGLAHWTTPGGLELMLFAAIGLLGTGGHLCMTWAYGRADASRLGVLEYTAFVWAGAIGFIIFGEVPAPSTLIGAALIVGGALIASRGAPNVAKPEIEVGP
ncbi:DMT family transporter [Ancylobacter pratisalsi]|uniref:DMT family transporter n=1 Tax=Ancylobacter pratisalsi TaxID=1745854 RepID=A0A6P1YKA7_9HYPH|nr:DMT family transporter [Ancylobacter pratisalsi]QIB33768.1 DMT family transporter [Ancylobacter pratisalsi]